MEATNALRLYQESNFQGEHPLGKPTTHHLTDLFYLILSLLEIKDVMHCSLVSKDWNQLVKADRLWKVLVEKKIYPITPQNGSTWLGELRRGINWKKGIYQQKTENQSATACYLHHQPTLPLYVHIFYKTEFDKKISKAEEHAISKVVVSNQITGKELYSFSVKKNKEENENQSPSCCEIFQKACWNLDVQFNVDEQDDGLHFFLHMNYFPISRFHTEENEGVAKINYLFFYIKDILTKHYYPNPIFYHNPKYQHTVCRHETEIWVLHEWKLKIYCALTSQLIKELDIPDEKPHMDMAILFNRILILTNQYLEIYWIENQETQKKFSIPIQESSKKMIIIPEDHSLYFGLYNQQDQILEMFDSTRGEPLCCLSGINKKNIRLDACSIRFVREDQEIVYSFDPIQKQNLRD